MFDKDEDGKLTEDELREIMLQMGDNPISEEEFENFINVIIKLIHQNSSYDHMAFTQNKLIANHDHTLKNFLCFDFIVLNLFSVFSS